MKWVRPAQPIAPEEQKKETVIPAVVGA